jgi:hypothetical protein
MLHKATSPYQAAAGAHAIVVLTEWDEFKSLPPHAHLVRSSLTAAYNYQQLFDNMLKPAFLFDGRLILDHAALLKIGFDVRVLGNLPSVHPIPACRFTPSARLRSPHNICFCLHHVATHGIASKRINDQRRLSFSFQENVQSRGRCVAPAHRSKPGRLCAFLAEALA